MKVLLVGIKNTIFLRELQQHLRDSGIKADRFDPGLGCFEDYEGKMMQVGVEIKKTNFIGKNLLLWRNFRIFKSLYLKLGYSYDVCNIHFLDVRYFFFRRFIFRAAPRLVISIYGSDFYKYRRFSFLQKSLYKKAADITFANQETLNSFSTYFKESNKRKLHICKFGLSRLYQINEINLLEGIKYKARENFRFPRDKVIITVGYHSNPITRQLNTLEQLNRLDPDIKKNLFLIFPMAYGGSVNNRRAVENLAESLGFGYTVIDKFLSDQDIALLRRASDIMIHLPVSDQLSATMCEYLFAFNYVITGAWLPYKTIDETGVYYSRVRSFNEVPALVQWAVEKSDECARLISGNPEKIWNFSSWEHNITKWTQVYSGV